MLNKKQNLKTYAGRVFVLGMLFLSGCSLFMPVREPEVSTYQISMQNDVSKTCNANNPKMAAESTIQITKMHDDPPYDTAKMYYSLSEYQLSSFARHAWIASPGEMLTRLIQERLIQSCKFSSVVSADFMTSAAYRLNSQLLELKQNINGKKSEMKLVVLVQLVENANNQVIKSRTFVERAAVPATPKGYVDGTNQVTKMFLDDLVVWLGN